MKHFVAIITLALCSQLVSAQLDFQNASLKTHNEYRRKHVSTPDMVQDTDLNKRAQECALYYADLGKIDHSCPNKNGAGENLFSGQGTFGNASTVASLAAKLFYDEIKQYNWDAPGFSGATGHFTQLVWVKSTKLGSGYVVTKDNKHFFVNLYLDHGNVNTKEYFQANVQKVK